MLSVKSAPNDLALILLLTEQLLELAGRKSEYAKVIRRKVSIEKVEEELKNLPLRAIILPGDKGWHRD